MTTKFLSKNEHLVYIKNNEPLPDTNGITYIAKILRSYTSNNKSWSDINLLTDAIGDRISDTRIVTVLSNRIVSERPWHDIKSRKIYHFGNILTAQSFVFKNTINRPLESTSRNALGSGIYGRYLNRPSDVNFIIGQGKVYELDCQHCYLVQDKEHGESITTASLITNRYLDNTILTTRGRTNFDFIESLSQIQSVDIGNLVTLWNIVFYRSGDYISQVTLENILADYLVLYLGYNDLFDSQSNEPI